MKIAIIGGRLQGLEAVYLTLEAGYDAALIDKNPFAPAKSLVNEFYHLDLLKNQYSSETLLKQFDFILPATENYQTLVWLNETAHRIRVPLALDLSAYTISCSKIKSNQLLAKAGISVPKPWPGCGFPVIIKPSDSSGSAGVVKVINDAQLEEAMATLSGETVIQQYLEGPSYSLEVIAHKGMGAGIQVTQLDFDSGYDCKRVLAGPTTGNDIAKALFDLGKRVAEILDLTGIMDIEVIDTGRELSVLEIDARLPSQTPSVVYHSTGLNMVKLLAECWTEGCLPERTECTGSRRAVILEHYRFDGGTLEVSGEHVLAGAQGLQLYRDIFSASVFIANFERSSQDWVATAIYISDTEAQAWESRNCALQQMLNTFQAKTFVDPSPPDSENSSYDPTVSKNH